MNLGLSLARAASFFCPQHDNMFYTKPEDSGILGINKAETTSGNTLAALDTTLGQSFTSDVVRRVSGKQTAE